jgi:hypothetical protein
MGWHGILRAAIISSVVLAIGSCSKRCGNDRDEAESATPSGGLPQGVVSGVTTEVSSSAPPEQASYWSDLSIWPSGKPQAGDDVHIAADQYIILDEDTPALGVLTIEGRLEFARKDITLTAGSIVVEGRFAIGSEAEPYRQQATIILNGPPGDDSSGFSRGIMVMGGVLELYGTPPRSIWTRLDGHAEAQANAVDILPVLDWKAGDAIAVAPTDYYLVAETQKLTIESVGTKSLELAEPVSAFRFGKLQYVSDDGLSFEAADQISLPGHLVDAPTVLDQRAVVGHLTRNITIAAPDDEHWQGAGFGVNVMIMGPGSSARADGISLVRAGQKGRLGRYPWHWHMLSYSAGRELGDAAGQFLRRSVVNESQNRGVVIHGTSGVAIEDNVLFDIKGHGIFTEDAVERRLAIKNNLVLKVRSPDAEAALKLHERNTGNPGGASGFWISNPDNVLEGNLAADCDGFGFWLSFPAQAWGENITVPIIPRRQLFGVFANNTAQSNRYSGLMLDLVEIDNDGNVAGSQYASTTDGLDPVWPRPHLRRFHLDGFATWKNGNGGIWDRASFADNTRIVSADNTHRYFAGAGEEGVIEKSLVIGTSLNAYSERPSWAGDPTPSAFATYHSSFAIRNNVVVNFPVVVGKRSGVFATEDYYLRAVDKGHIHNEGNLLINSHPGYRMPAVWPNGVTATHFNLAGALWDPYGTWGGEGHYFVYDAPFYTYGVSTVEPTGGVAAAGGTLAPGPYYGINAFVVDQANDAEDDRMALAVDRLNPNDLTSVVGSLGIDAAPADWLLAHMRSFAAHRDGIYRLRFPDRTLTSLRLTFEALLTTDDTLVLAVPLAVVIASDAEAPVRISRPNPYLVEAYSKVGSVSDVRNSPGATWYQDEDKVVWVKIRGGSWVFWTDDPDVALPTADDLLYEPMYLHIDGG